MSKKVMLFSLQTFSTTGGIQKMTRTLAHSLYHVAKENNWDFKMLAAYDADHDLMPQYLPSENFRGFNSNRISFVLQSLKEAAKADVIILSHINLAFIGVIIKTINPKCKVWLIAHGIEVWRPLSKLKKVLLSKCDKVISVSNFTRQQVITMHNADAAKSFVLNNAIDPFMKLPHTFSKPQSLLTKYGLTGNEPLIFTLTRLAASEQYKGHEQVIKAIGKLKNKLPAIKYMLSGQYDTEEGIRIKELIAANNVQEQVILTGFVAEKDLSDHFLLADLFVLPSKKEGFGIVFIEALACGLPVICGNADGSIDAIRNGELGKAIDVNNITELEEAITESLKVPLTLQQRENLQQQCLLHFNEQDYMNKLQQLLNDGSIS
ncbi:Glycosyltransferase involved in cell wall bisynthesis [Mucilaginibacter mallensis]|uniref:Glycosyltransferase involved in cell wall bisynthesis n=1 Tax=Mucilaginibacter mallensis TaxID=652787 RepID=A0A1H2B476_MUCMA|nr:glycosyltransferase family 4 protein [Mucilaginibacter mallensis]SDT52973.1 Glycosyltransferase involved in cell wall bisynthesis [Mucilaginibacter mallensis]